MSSRFSIEQLREDDRDKALSLLLNSFFQEEPLAKHLQLGQPMDFAQTVLNDGINGQCSFVLHDHQTNQLVGICLNEMKYSNDKDFIPLENEKLSFILHFLSEMHHEVNLFDQFETNSLLHIFVINIEKNVRGNGLASQLISATIEHAKNVNIKGIYAEATSSYSSNCFKEQHFQIYHQKKYTDYDPIRLANLNDQCELLARLV